MEINEEKRQKFMDYATKRVNNVMHDIAILEPMARSAAYDFTKDDVEEMFSAMQQALDNAKEEYYKKFEAKTKASKQAFTFGQAKPAQVESTESVEVAEPEMNEADITMNTTTEL